MSTGTPAPKTFWPKAIILFYAAFAAAMVGFVVFTMYRPTDLVSPDYYERELRHEDQLARERNGNDPAACAFGFDEQARRITLEFPPGAVTGTVALYRPSAADQDRTLAIAVDAEGVQHIDCAACASGLWKVRVHWQQDGRDCFREHDVVMP